MKRQANAGDLGYYILKGTEVVPVTFEEWVAWYRDHEAESCRIVKQEDVGDFWVSTVFRDGIDVFGDKMLFETALFRRAGKEHVAILNRYSTYEDALVGHLEATEEIRRRQRLALRGEAPPFTGEEFNE